MDFPQRALKVDNSKLLRSQEFAQQLIYLRDNKMTHQREGEIYSKDEFAAPITDYVSNWLIVMLANRSTKTTTNDEFPMISKKIRDDVIGANSDSQRPFRRSGFYTFLKVLLQLHLNIEFDEDHAHFFYKLIMMKFLSNLCFHYTTDLYATLKTEVAIHLMAKIARRIEKLDDQSEYLVISGNFEIVYQQVVKEAKTVVANVRKRIDKQIAQLNNEGACMLSPLTDLDFNADLKQKLPKLEKYLKDRHTSNALVFNQNKKILLKKWPRHYNTEDMPDTKDLNDLAGPTDTFLYLCDFENWILYKTDLQNGSYKFENKAKMLRQWSFLYGAKAMELYKGDPLNLSRMLLVQLKIVAFMDKIVSIKHSMYGEHRSGINEKVLDRLLLPHRIDMDIADELQQYFKRRNAAANYGLLEEKTISEKSFAYRFARSNPHMQRILTAILSKQSEAEKRYGKQLKKMRKTIEVEMSNSACDECDGKGCVECKIMKVKMEAEFEHLLPKPSDDTNERLLPNQGNFWF